MGSLAGSASGGAEEVVTYALERLPAPFNLSEPGGEHDSKDLPCVILQECTHVSSVLLQIRDMLQELQEVMQGTLAVTEVMEQRLEALKRSQVPAEWLACYSSAQTSFASWLQDLCDRVAQLDEWWHGTIPTSVWLPGLFNPRALVTAIVQLNGQACGLPLDAMTAQTQMTSVMDASSIEHNAAEKGQGQFIHGISMEGARWDTAVGELVESKPRETYSACPVMKLMGVCSADYQHGEGYYECPIYATPTRGPTYVLSAQLPCKGVSSRRWVLSGVAMILAIPPT